MNSLVMVVFKETELTLDMSTALEANFPELVTKNLMDARFMEDFMMVSVNSTCFVTSEENSVENA